MHAEPEGLNGADPLNEAEDATANEENVEGLPIVTHSLMDVLMPAKPPEVKNARIIRLFDIEAAKTDPQPGVPEVPKAQHERKNREEARAQRNRSLLAAARFKQSS